MNKRLIQCQLKALNKKLQELETGEAIGSYVTGGRREGQTLILEQTSFGDVNIDLGDFVPVITFENLTTVQCNALSECVRGDAVYDAFGVLLGYLLRT